MLLCNWPLTHLVVENHNLNTHTALWDARWLYIIGADYSKALYVSIHKHFVDQWGLWAYNEWKPYHRRGCYRVILVQHVSCFFILLLPCWGIIIYHCLKNSSKCNMQAKLQFLIPCERTFYFSYVCVQNPWTTPLLG